LFFWNKKYVCTFFLKIVLFQMNYCTNAYDNVMITFDGSKELPELLYESEQVIAVCHAPEDFKNDKLPYTLGFTKEHGWMFGNKFSTTKFPVLQEDHALGAATVIFAKNDDEKSPSTYAVLVQCKGKRQLMNPAGFMAATDKNVYATCAVREVEEETGLKLEASEWIPIASWKFDMKFANLNFVGHTACGFCSTTLPKTWQDQIQGPLTVIPIQDNEETESIVLIDIQYLQDEKTLKAAPMPVSAHHFNLLLYSAVRMTQADRKCLKDFMSTSYLRSINYVGLTDEDR
jgi:8-oxo-dGTP pyrophosphatase MutT (NUDIX family)